ncbi:MAG: DUF4342 domain-containing protein [Bacillota bacterium]
MDERLEKLDSVMARAGVGAAAAREALEASNWDVVEALVYLDRKSHPEGPTWQERLEVEAGDLAEKVKSLIREGNVRSVRIRNDRGVLLEIPVTVGAIGAVILPEVALLGALAAMAGVFTIEIERSGGEPWRLGRDKENPAP